MAIVTTSTSGAPSVFTYATLKDAIGNWLHRTDLAARSEEFIALAEAKFNRELRIEDMVSEYAGSILEPEITLPDDFLEAISLDVGGDAYQFRSRTQFFSLEGNYYTRRGDRLILAANLTESTDVSLVYYARVPALSDTNTNNWLLLAAPDLYLYSALLEAVPYLHLAADDTRPAQWANGRTSALSALQAADDNSRFSGQSLTISIPR